MAAFFRRRTRHAPREGAPTLEEVRERVHHVVVLMLENRSFDHLFGFLDLPGADPFDPAEHPNPVDRADAAKGVAVAGPGGMHLLQMDPPHSHASAQQQLGEIVRRRHRMDGFVDAYRLKLLHRDHVPEIRWNRLRGVAVGLGVLFAAAVGDVVRRVDGGSWAAIALLVAAAAVAGAALLVAVRPLGKAADLAGWKVVTGVAVVSTVATFGLSGLVGQVRDPSWPTLAGAVVMAAVAWRAVDRAQKKYLVTRTPPTGAAADAAEAAAPRIMRCMPPERVQVLGLLAEQFATCHRWFSSVPGATWPNRNFIHAGTSAQSVDIEIGLYDDKTLFELLDDQARDAAAAGDASTLTDPPWHIYRDGMPQVMAFKNLWSDDLKDRWRTMAQFEADCAAGTLPTYAFLEPRHSGSGTNSLHPGNNEKATDGTSDFARGEALVRDVYLALRDAPGGLFDRTVLVVTFDEHGGLFDHVSPPSTVHPDPRAAVRHPVLSIRRLVAWFVEHRNAPFDFRRLGVRVPTVIVSPLIEPRTADRGTYDHTSVIATVRDLFAPDRPALALGRRARDARPFWDLLTRTSARPMPDVPAPDYGPEPQVVAGEEAVPTVPVVPGPPAAPDASHDGNLADQLTLLAAKADPLLTERGAPGLVTAEGDAPLDPTDLVSTRLQVWADD